VSKYNAIMKIVKVENILSNAAMDMIYAHYVGLNGRMNHYAQYV
jgi:hypothetical protein